MSMSKIKMKINNKMIILITIDKIKMKMRNK